MFLDKERRNYLYLYAYVLFIYISLPFTPDIWGFIYNTIGKESALVIPFIFAGITVGAILSYLLFYKKERNGLTYLIFIAIVAAYFLGMRMVQLPAEKLHFLEYGGVGYFSLRLYTDRKKAYLMATSWIFLIGFIDEFIQYLLPNRFFEIHDVFTNFTGGILALLLMRFVIRTRRH